jgi:competence protein ComEA
MHWLHLLQQRLAITRREALAILSVLALFFAGLLAEYVQKRNVPPVDRSLLLTDSLDLSDTLHVSDTTQPPVAQADAAGAPSPTPAAGKDPFGRAVNLNTASSTQLEELPGIGPSLADRIIRHRERRPFTSVEQLTSVRGIGPKTLDAVRPLVRVGEP